MYNIATKSIALILLASLTACQSIPKLIDEEQQRLSVDLFYQGGQQGRSGDTLTVKLEDVSKADSTATIISEQSIAIEQQAPTQANLHFDPQQIDSKNRYTLRAMLYRDDALVMHGYRSIDPLLNSQGGTAAVILKPLEHTANAQTLSGKWLLNSANNTTASHGAWLLFDDEAKRVSGNSGCNNFFAQYQTKAPALTIGQAGATMKMCDEKSMQLEQDFLAALAKVASFKITNNSQLVLLDGEQKALLSFSAVP